MDSLLDKKLLGFRQVAQEKLQHIFYSIPSEKDLIIEPSLIKPLEYVCGASWLRKKGIDKIYKFDQKNPPPKRKQFVYFITANLLTFKCVLDQISGYHSQTSSMMEPDLRTQQYHIVVFPLVMASFEHLLEEEGLFGVAELYSFQWDFLLLDHSVLSLELPDIFADVFVRKDTALLGSMAQSLRLFNLIMGKPKLIFALGENAEKVLQMVQRIEATDVAKTPAPEEKEPDFSAMLVVDRDRDYPTCLLTPVVYAGLLLEIHKLTSGSLVVDAATNKIKSGKLSILRGGGPAKVTPETGAGTTLRMSGTQDKVYQEHRYRHFSEVISLLSAQAKALGVEGKAYSRDMKLNEMKDYVTNKLPRVAAQKKELFKHLLLCETIVEEIGANFEKHQMIEESVLTNTNRKQIMAYIEELLSSDAHRNNTLRLICLYHVTIGLTSDDMTKLMTGYLNAFGYHHLTVFHKLFQAKLFPDTTNLIKGKMLSQISIPILKTPFQIEANKLKLLPTDANEGSAATASKVDRDSASGAKSGSPSFVFNGNYIPLVAQLTQIILGATNCDELNAKLGHLERLKVSGKALGDAAAHSRTIKELSISGHKVDINRALPLRPRTFFVLVIGGLTYAEIAACATLEKLLGAKIVLASDTIVAGHDLIERVVDC